MELFNLESEKALLGNILSSEDSYSSYWLAAKYLGETGKAFFLEKHRMIYGAVSRAVSLGRPITPSTIERLLGKEISEVGRTYLDELVSCARPLETENLAREISDFFVFRKIVEAGREISHVPQEVVEPSEALERVRKIVGTLSLPKSEKSPTVNELLGPYLDRIEDRQRKVNSPDYRAITFPWASLRARVPRVEEGTLTVIAAGPGAGKTSFCEQWSEYLAREGFSVAFFLFELSVEDMMDRMIARHSGLSFYELREPRNPEVLERVTSALGKISEWKGRIIFVPAAGWSMAAVIGHIQELHPEGLDVAIIDYLNLMKFIPYPGQSDVSAIDSALNDLKATATRLGIVVVIVAQLDKASRSLRIKTLSGIKGSGGLEERANLGITLSRERLSEPQNFGELGFFQEGDMSPIVTLRVDKSTFGPVGEFKMVFIGSRFAFGELKE